MFQRLLVRGTLFLAAHSVLPLASHTLAQTQEPGRAAEAVDSLVGASVQSGKAAGAVVVVAKGAGVPVIRAYGRADMENDVPMTPEHVFPIASVTKQFTAAAVLKLAEQGRIKLDEPITTYLPDAPTQGKRVTVRQLLAHTSGMVDVTEVPRFRSVERLDLAPDSVLALVRNEPFHFQPGEQMRYSNSGYLLLGKLIQTVSGQSYADFLAEHLFRPAGMPNSRYCDQRALIPRRASGYEYTPEGLVRARFVSLQIPFAAGGICSTAADLVAWNRALHGGRILGPAMYREMIRPAVLAGGRKTRYGLGMALGEMAGHSVLHHGGDIQGFTSYSAYFPEDSLAVVVLLNTQGPARPDAMSEQIAQATLGQRGEASAAHAPRDLARFVGEYGEGTRVTLGRSGLHIAGSPWGAADLRFVGGTTFTDGRALYTFESDEGQAPALWADFTWALVRWDRQQPGPSTPAGAH